MEQKPSVVLYPWIGMGHIIPMVELAKLFVEQGFSVTIALIETTSYSTRESFISRVSSTHPAISLHRLPKVTPPLSKPPMSTISESTRLANQHLLEFLESRKANSNIRALVLDMFCSSALEVAGGLRIPSYFFISIAAFSLAAFLFLPIIQSQLHGGFRELGDTPLDIPGLPPIPASDLPSMVMERSEENDAFFSHFEIMPSADGLMINTFESFEKRAVQALVDGACVPGRTMPPIYCIGTLIGSGHEDGERHECLAWLDAQPEKSVVFLCFGSMGSFSVEQLKEMATGLERSGQRFLWVVRSPPEDPTKLSAPRPEPDLGVLLPKGFLERTRGRGMVVKSWSPQAAVLGHKSVGAFVSHCGWNSTMEAVCSGVPMIGWPLYAEQRMNKIFLVEEAKVVVGIEGYDEGLVSAEELETKIKWVMESGEERALRDRMAAKAAEAAAARKKDGTSALAMAKLVRALITDNQCMGD